jgi:hypothetical protein
MRFALVVILLLLGATRASPQSSPLWITVFNASPAPQGTYVLSGNVTCANPSCVMVRIWGQWGSGGSVDEWVALDPYGNFETSIKVGPNDHGYVSAEAMCMITLNTSNIATDAIVP